MVVAGLCGLLSMWRGLALRTVPVSLYSLWLLLAAGIAAIQCVPLPAALRSMLPLASEPLLRQTLADIGGYPHKPLPLSLDPAETANEAVRLLGYVCALGVFSTLRTRHGDSYRLAGMVVMVGSLVAGLGSLAALGVTLPGTLAVTTEGQSRALWPAVLQNANHMAALLSLTAILALGMLLQTDRQARPQRFGALCAVLGLVNLALLFSLSRAGVLCGLVGQLLTLLSADSPVPKTKRQRLWWVVLPSLGLLLAMLFGPAAPLVGRWRELSHGLSPAGSKVWLWHTAWPLLKAHPLTGIGRGALETALQAPTAIATTTRFTHLENEWLQALLGPYPYGKALRLVIGPTYWLGFEHPGNIVLAQNLVTQRAQIDAYSDPLRHVLMHEITHQWAGDHATLADTYEVKLPPELSEAVRRWALTLKNKDGSALSAQPIPLTAESFVPGQWEHVTFAGAGIQEIPVPQ